MSTIILVLHILVAAAIIVLVLLQHGKGADMGAAFGSGASGSLFGATGSANFLSRSTAILAAIFFLTSLGLTYLSMHREGGSSVMSVQKVPEQKAVPATKAPPATPAPQDAGNNPGSKAKEIPK